MYFEQQCFCLLLLSVVKKDIMPTDVPKDIWPSLVGNESVDLTAFLYIPLRAEFISYCPE